MLEFFSGERRPRGSARGSRAGFCVAPKQNFKKLTQARRPRDMIRGTCDVTPMNRGTAGDGVDQRTSEVILAMSSLDDREGFVWLLCRRT